MFKAFGASSSIWKRTQTWHLESICSPLNLPNLDKPERPRISLPLAKVGLSETDNDNGNNNPAIYNLQCDSVKLEPKRTSQSEKNLKICFIEKEENVSPESPLLLPLCLQLPSYPQNKMGICFHLTLTPLGKWTEVTFRNWRSQWLWGQQCPTGFGSSLGILIPWVSVQWRNTSPVSLDSTASNLHSLAQTTKCSGTGTFPLVGLRNNQSHNGENIWSALVMDAINWFAWLFSIWKGKAFR